MTAVNSIADADRYDFRAGPLTGWFDRRTAALRDICWGSKCVWRELVMLVRGSSWETVATCIELFKGDAGDNDFQIRFDAHSRGGSIDFRWIGFIVGDARGRIRFDFAGEAVEAFQANRIGFCLMHPGELYAGEPIEQHRVDGQVVQGRFPTLVEPQILGKFSIFDLAGLNHQVAEGVWGEARFAGEVFETEDQRNWTDASFKTYCTPLALPIPVSLRPGERRRQAIELRLTGFEQTAAEPVGRLVVDLPMRRSTLMPMPKFGIALPPPNEPLPDSLEPLERMLSFDTVRFDLHLSDRSLSGSTASRLQKAFELLEGTAAKLELAVYLPRNGAADFDRLTAVCTQQCKAIERVIVYRQGSAVSLSEDLNNVRRAIGSLQLPIGGGSDANFCELNRDRSIGNFRVEDCDFICWAANPQVHAFDNHSIMQTPLSAAAIVATAKEFSAGQPLILSPLTLRSRPHAGVITNDWPEVASDLRQTQQVAAAWSVATWHQLAAAGIDGVTWSEAYGARGFAAEVEGQLSLLPAAACFAKLAAAAAESFELLNTGPTSISAARLHGKRGSYLSLVNCENRPQQVVLEMGSDREVALGLRERLTLKPYEVRLMASG